MSDETAQNFNATEVQKKEQPPEKVLASLVQLDENDQPAAQKPISITREITLIGRDPSLSQLVLADPSLEPLQAQLHIYANGSVRLTDFGSDAGTYINYKPITGQSAELHHGDLINFGSLKFRFNSLTHVLGANPKK